MKVISKVFFYLKQCKRMMVTENIQIYITYIFQFIL